MKKVIKGIAISALLVGSLSADYKLILTDKDGVQTEKCIKSYSFSNNLESIAKQKGITQDVYSEEEVVTNKVYKGKPVYRKIVSLPSNLIGDKTWREVNYINAPVNIDVLISANPVGNNLFGANSLSGNIYDKHYVFYKEHFGYSIGSGMLHAFNGIDIIMEYTKTTDTVNTQTTEFKSYFHYVPSSSTTGELTSIDMKDVGVRFLENHTYDNVTGSCNPNQ